MDHRQHLMDSINSNGGDYRGDLTREVTHLIAKTAEGKKYAYAGAWGIKIVSCEWLNDSLERGMILDESLYHPLMPVEERGKNAWLRRTTTTDSLGKRMRDDEPAQITSRKLRRTASAKLGSQNDGIWTDIVGGGFGPQQRRKSEWEEQRRKVDVTDDRSESINKITESVPTNATLSEARPSNESSESRAPTLQGADDAGFRRGMFRGKLFFIHGFDDRKVCHFKAKASVGQSTNNWCLVIDFDIAETSLIT